MLGAAALALGGAAALLPLGELYAFLQFRLAPEAAKVRHLRWLRQPTRDLDLLLVGSAHYLHVDTDDYPLWELKALITGWRPDTVAVEIRPEAVRAHRWGEGPIEMPFCAAVARDQGARVLGVDDWSPDWDQREDAMVRNLLDQLGPARRAIVFTGFSHVPGFVRRLRRHGFDEHPWPAEQRAALLHTPVEPTYPPDLRALYEQAIERAQRGETPFDADWIARRAAFAARLPHRAPPHEPHPARPPTTTPGNP